MKKVFLTVALLLAATAMVFAQNNPESDFEVYRSKDGKSIIIDTYVGKATVVNIPPRIQNLPVTEIDIGAFERAQITSVTIPAGVLTIGRSAFMTCLSLERVTIPNTVTTIGDSAFANCVNLKSVIIPNSVTTIGNGAFSQSGLETITIGTGITRIGTNAFSYALLKTLIINAATPPALGRSLFNNPNNDLEATLQIKVPAARVNQYKTSDWSVYADRISAQ
jgi:hypothetical protein